MKKLTDEQALEFETLSELLLKFLNDNCHPHCKIIISPTSSELVEGQVVLNTNKFLKD